MPDSRVGRIEVFGPFWRAANSRMQDHAGMRRIIESGELWGRPPAYSTLPAVQAYMGKLPPDKPGFEFFALTPPDQEFGFVAYWRERDDQSVRVDDDVALR
jgi:hypothetical protein